MYAVYCSLDSQEWWLLEEDQFMEENCIGRCGPVIDIWLDKEVVPFQYALFEVESFFGSGPALKNLTFMGDANDGTLNLHKPFKMQLHRQNPAEILFNVRSMV